MELPDPIMKRNTLPGSAGGGSLGGTFTGSLSVLKENSNFLLRLLDNLISFTVV